VRGAGGHSLVEVLVAMLLVVAGLLPVGHALAAGIRLGREGEASARVALALMARASMLQQEAAGSDPRCQRLRSGGVAGPTLAEWWTTVDSGRLRPVVAHARAMRTFRPIEDSVTLRIRCP
jgi:Tfp pilus assembly protein PilV